MGGMPQLQLAEKSTLMKNMFTLHLCDMPQESVVSPVVLSMIVKKIMQFSFLVESIGFSMYTIISSTNSDSFISSFPIWMPFYFLFLSDFCG